MQKKSKQCIRISVKIWFAIKHIENNSNNTSSTAMPQVKGRPRPSTKASMPTRPKWRPTRKEHMSHTWVSWANIEMQILPMEKTHSLQLTLGHAQVKTIKHKSVTQVTKHLSSKTVVASKKHQRTSSNKHKTVPLI